jgi:hypothetical protein
VQSFESIDVFLIDCCKLAQNVLNPNKKKKSSLNSVLCLQKRTTKWVDAQLPVMAALTPSSILG